MADSCFKAGSDRRWFAILVRLVAAGRTEAAAKAEEGFPPHAENANTSSAPADAPPIVHEVLGGSGQPLDSSTRAFMEPRFGRDFGNVRVHIDARAKASARSVDALAYTVGQTSSSPPALCARRSSRPSVAGARADACRPAIGRAHCAGRPLQRQPDETSTKESPPAKTPPTKTAPPKPSPRKTLQREGVDLNDPVAGRHIWDHRRGSGANRIARAVRIGDEDKAGLRSPRKASSFTRRRQEFR